ncbi:DUF4422 domain-containing protein [Candidatus Pelagibacter sp.]|nr:DUF4422 domain-containing protein [Candidatus Pelagibacter sp.]
MKNLEIYCMCLKNSNLAQVNKLKYKPVGLKNNDFSNKWIRDNSLQNISKKNPFYGEYTFYYWYWKNLLRKKKKSDWVGFCSYREFWGNKDKNTNKKIKDKVLQKISPEWKNFDVIIGEPIFINGFKLMKTLKYGKLALLRNPLAVFKSKRTIRYQFDMYHGNGNLDKAIDLLPKKDRGDFRNFTRSEVSFSQGNMFIAKSDKIIDAYFKDVFSWLKKCEKVFGYDLKGYGEIRMYTFLAERYLSFWFKKYTKYLEWPVVYHDINKKKN